MFGEIFLVRFPFTSGAASKLRPALVLFDIQQDAIICRVTSVQRAGRFDVSLSDWQQAGLAAPSVARLDKIVTAEKHTLVRRLGELSDRDQLSVRAAWNREMAL